MTHSKGPTGFGFDPGPATAWTIASANVAPALTAELRCPLFYSIIVFFIICHHQKDRKYFAICLKTRPKSHFTKISSFLSLRTIIR